ncbi:MAG: 2-succinyl-5-enolpyruvyl-6-hydroxy-3-cyclohexene-1-carboxylic-acid synthase [Elainellaceae cyanobacterium]
MSLDFRTINTVWASILVETLGRLGLTTAVICPGSRSAPMAVAFARSEVVESIPVLDERSASFFALGLARRSHRPVALVCTSGTAGANMYPAVIEAHESRVPLIILTADRPPELRGCNAGQAIDQQKLYGSFPNWYTELATPSLDVNMLDYLRQMMVYAWERSRAPVPGPVHLNIPFRDPLAPISQLDAQALESRLNSQSFFSHLSVASDSIPYSSALIPSMLFQIWQQHSNGLIIAGPAQPQFPKPYCEAIARLSKMLGFPVLAEGLSPLRNYASLNPYLISTYDLMLRNPRLADELTPEIVIRIGEMPTSKILRDWLTATQPQQWIVDESDRNLDPLHGLTHHLRISVESLAPQLEISPAMSPSIYLKNWCKTEAIIRQLLDQAFADIDDLFEGKVAWMLSQILPKNTPLFISNSTPVRDVEWFWKPNDLGIQPFFNRGANGIDGTLSSALGISYRHRPTVLLTGDLALLHDTNGFLLKQQFVGQLTIVLVNNNGGGIFELLPISQFDPPFEDYFATPQSINFHHVCQTYKVEYIQIHTWSNLIDALTSPSNQRVRVLEVPTNRQTDPLKRQSLFQMISQDPSLAPTPTD